MGAYNYGLGNRDMAWAGYNALKRDSSGLSFSGVDTTSMRWGRFCQWAKGQGGSSAWKKSARPTWFATGSNWPAR